MSRTRRPGCVGLYGFDSYEAIGKSAVRTSWSCEWPLVKISLPSKTAESS